MNNLCVKCKKNICDAPAILCKNCEIIMLVYLVSSYQNINLLAYSLPDTAFQNSSKYSSYQYYEICNNCGFTDVFLSSCDERICQCCGKKSFTNVNTQQGKKKLFYSLPLINTTTH